MAPRSKILATLSSVSTTGRSLLPPSQHRCISSTTTTQLSSTWVEKIKGVFTGQKASATQDPSQVTAQSFTLLRFADELKNARKLGTFKQYMVGRSSEATFANAFDKQEAIIRYLGAFDPAGENLQSSQKQEAAKHCHCTIADVENTLAKFTWAKEAQRKIEKLKDEGKPMPKSLAEVQKLMGTTPMDVARSSMAKSGQISRNAFCPCGSKKRYKRYSVVQGLKLNLLKQIRDIAKVLWEGLKRIAKRDNEKAQLYTPALDMREIWRGQTRRGVLSSSLYVELICLLVVCIVDISFLLSSLIWIV